MEIKIRLSSNACWTLINDVLDSQKNINAKISSYDSEITYSGTKVDLEGFCEGMFLILTFE